MTGKLSLSLLLSVILFAAGPVAATAEEGAPVLPQNVASEVQKKEAESGGGNDDDLSRVKGAAICRVTVSKYNTVSIHAQNVRISTVLQALAVKSHRNIILAAGADRVVSMTFYSVPFKDALKTMLDVNGLAYREADTFISVFTKKELIDRVQGAEGLSSIIYQLNYLRPKDAVLAVKGLLSKDGSVQVMEDDKPEGKTADMSLEGTKKSDPVYSPESQKFSLRSSLVAHDYQENLDAVAALLKKLDKRPPQVLLEATILEVTLDESNALGVDFALLKSTSFMEFFNFPKSYGPFSTAKRDPATGDFLVDSNGSPIGYKTQRSSGDAMLATSMGNVGAGAATIRGGFSYSDFGVFIRALSQYTNVSVLSNPKVLSLDRQRARVMMGQNVGYIESNFDNGQVVQTTKFIETGVVLDVRPYILDNGRVRLVLAPKVSKVNFRNQQLQGGVTQQIPDETIKTVAADIVIPQGATAVIGGLFQEETTKNAQQIPFLGDTPVLGPLARGQDDKVVRKELVFMIRATILNDNELADMGNSNENDAAQMLSGSRRGLLPWSKMRQSANLSLKATRALHNGHRDLAAWMARRSLQLSSRQPDVIRQLVDTVEPDTVEREEGPLFDMLRKRVGDERMDTTPPPALEDEKVLPLKSSPSPVKSSRTRVTPGALPGLAQVISPTEFGAGEGDSQATATPMLVQVEPVRPPIELGDEGVLPDLPDLPAMDNDVAQAVRRKEELAPELEILNMDFNSKDKE